MVRLVAGLWAGCQAVGFAWGQVPENYAVEVSAAVQANPAQITLSWPADPNATGYFLSRKLRDAVSWGSSVSLPTNAAGYVDTNNISVGGAYEYNIQKVAANYFGAGYVYAGIALPPVVSRGKVILIVDSSNGASLVLELSRLAQDLVGDGWTVVRHDVPRMAVDPANQSSSVWGQRAAELANVKALIQADYNADPANVNSVFLIGHVPVPYSGNFAPDGHSDHQGAWPADVYYADMTGAWTDAGVTATTAADPRNINVPGDGKFDASIMPANATLRVGRVDFANLPAFSLSETELLRQYLNKDHVFRQKWVVAAGAGLIDDIFGTFGGEAFAADGWRNFAPMFGAANNMAGAWPNSPGSQVWLWGYGCGNGFYYGAAGVDTTAQLAIGDPPVMFTMLFGSYFGDWDSQNNFMRASIATPTYTLSCAWAGRPFWYFHHMALGETIGFSTRVSQNNQSTYSSGNASLFTYFVHVALMGDPTLRLSPIAPPSALNATPGGGGVNLSWKPSADAGVGYLVFGGPAVTGPFAQLTTAPITGTSYTDPGGGQSVYMVRSVNLQLTSSGTYTNLSQGVFQSPGNALGGPQIVLSQPGNGAPFVILSPDTTANIPLTVSTFDPANLITKVAFTVNGTSIGSTATAPFSFGWNNVLPGGYSNLIATATYSGGQTVSSSPVTVTVEGPPVVTFPPQTQAVAAGNTVTFQVAVVGTAPLSFQWTFNGANLPGATTAVLNLPNVQSAQAGGYAVVISNAFGSATSSTANLTVGFLPVILSQTSGGTVVEGDTISFSVNASGTPPLLYQWNFNGAPLPGATDANLTLRNVVPGQGGLYTVSVSDVFGSTTSSPAMLTVQLPPTIITQPASQSQAIGREADFQVIATGTAPLTYQWQFKGTNILGATDDTLVLTALQSSEAGGYAVLVANVAGSLLSSVASLSVTAVMPPMLVQAPAPQTATVGSNVTFEIVVSGTGPFSYQWALGGTNLLNATAATLVLNNVQTNQAGSYTVVVTNFTGSAISESAKLTVLAPPAISSPLTDQMVAVGSNVTLQVAATGTSPLSYQWMLDGANLLNATTDTLLLTNVQPAQSGNYTVQVTNVAGIAGSTALLTVVTPPFIESYSSSVNVATNSNTSFDVVAGGTPPLTYQWFFNGVSIPGATTNFYYVLNATHAQDGGYNAVIANFAGSVTSPVATLTVEMLPVILAQPTNQTVIVGTNVTFQVEAGAPPLTYQWTFNGANLPGATSDTLTLTDVQGAQSGNYAVTAFNLAGMTTSTNAVLTVLVPPTLISAPVGLTVPAGTNVSFQAVASGTAPLSYLWSFGDTLLPGATNATLTLTNVQPTNSGSYTVVVTNFLGSTLGASAILNVLDLPTLLAEPTNQTVFAGTNVSLQVIANGSSPLSYQWTFNNTNLLGATTNTLTLANVQTAQAGSYAVTVSNQVGSVVSPAATLAVLVPPSFSVQPTNQTVLIGTNAGFQVVAAGTAPLSYQWLLNATNLAGATTDTLALTNVQPDQAGAYTVVVTNLGGSATSVSATLAVLVPPSFTVQPAGQTVAAGTNVSLQVVVAGSNPLSYQWAVDGVNVPGATDAGLVLTNAQPRQSGGYTVTVTNLAGSILSATAVLDVYFPPGIAVQPTNQTVVAGAGAGFQVAATGTSPLAYQWVFEGANLAGSTTANFVLSNAQPAQAGRYWVVISNPVGSVASLRATLSVVVPPTLTLQPTNQTVIAGANTSFQAAAAGSSPLSYQWAFNGTNLLGAITDTLLLTNAQPEQTGNYSVTITNLAGMIRSSNALLTVLTPPSILSQPTNLTVLAGTDAGFQVMAAGSDPLSYQWVFNGASLPRATNNALVLTNAQPTLNGVYAVVITNPAGSVQSAGVTLTVLVPPSLTRQPANQSAIAGSSLSFKVTAEGTFPLIYQWLFNGTNLSGATNEVLSLADVQPVQAGNYMVIVTNPGGSAASIPAGLDVLIPPVITLQPTNQSVIAGANASFQVAATGSSPLSYQWVFNGTNLLGFTSDTLLLGSAQPAQAGSYSVTITNLAGSVLSTNAVLTVVTPPSILSQPANQTVIAGGDAGFQVIATGGGPYSYQWLFNGAGLPGATADTLAFTNVQPAQSGNYLVEVTYLADSITSAAAALRVLAPPTIMDIQVSRADVAISITSFVGLNYTLEYKNALSAPQWVSLPPVQGTGGVIVLHDAGAAANSRFYRIIAN